MISKIPEPTINKENPFINCKLDRRKYADILTKIVSQNQGCVFAIDGEWGSGKTTFVKMWKQSLVNERFNVLYFNVWEHDFITDPIIGLVSQFRDMNNHKTKKTLKKLIATAGKMTTGIFPAIVKDLTKKSFGEDVAAVLESATQTIANSFEEVINKYAEQCQSMTEFRKTLEDLVANVIQEGKPLIFIIDELDRCNPRFAVKVLERVKHLFSVPNIIFVLSIDKTQLCHSICGYYGSENLNSEEYLKRFIDIEYRLPAPNIESFLNHLYRTYEFDTFFSSKSKRNGDEKDRFLEMSHTLFEHMRFNLRQMEKIFAHIRIAIQTFRENQYVNPGIVLMLMCFRIIDKPFYNQILNKNLTAQELLNHIEETLPKTLFIENEYNRYTFNLATWETARLITSYNLNMEGGKNEELIKKISVNNQSEDTFKLLISPKVIPLKSLQEAIKWFHENSHRYDRAIPLNHITQHIELLTPLQW